MKLNVHQVKYLYQTLTMSCWYQLYGLMSPRMKKGKKEHVCEEEVPLNNNIGKQSGDLVEMPSEAVEQGMYVYEPDEIGGAKCEQVPNHVVNKGILEVLICKQVANYGGDELVDKGRPLKRKMVYAE
ncbi:hypothetical protein Tco_1260141 [Tanacetum coccineum]